MKFHVDDEEEDDDEDSGTLKANIRAPLRPLGSYTSIRISERFTNISWWKYIDSLNPLIRWRGGRWRRWFKAWVLKYVETASITTCKCVACWCSVRVAAGTHEDRDWEERERETSGAQSRQELRVEVDEAGDSLPRGLAVAWNSFCSQLSALANQRM